MLKAPRFRPRARRAISDASDLVMLEPMGEMSIPILAQPVTNGVDLIAWAESERDQINARLQRFGAILFRGFDVRSAAEFERFITAISEPPIPYVERSSPRTPAGGHIYSSTEYPPEHAIFLHCENSYQKTWPLKIFFYCEMPALEGGLTPIANTRRILAEIKHEVQEKFARKGIKYVRNFGAGLGLSWQTVFQTQDRYVVERYCSSAGIEYRWDNTERLRTTQVRKAIQIHPVTGESVWFNHAVFFHYSTLAPSIQQVLQASMSEEDLPNNTYYGDGSQIESEALDHLRAVYDKQTVSFPWQQGDILMLDNMLTAHGRTAYRGMRKILVGMTEPYSA